MRKFNRILDVSVLLGVLYCARRYYRNWGTTKAESQMLLPGDMLVREPASQATEAVYVDATVAVVWAELLRLLDDDSIRQPDLSARVRDAGGSTSSLRQQLAAGEMVRLLPAAWLGQADSLRLTVDSVVPEDFVVLRVSTPGENWNVVLSFHLEPHWEDRVRVVSRVRVGLRHPGEVLIVELLRPALALATRGFLLRLKRAAQSVNCPSAGQAAS